MALKFGIRFSGSGGHGLIQAARIIAEAAAVYDNKTAAESCSYGPEARGNASRAEIIISDRTIDIPKLETIDLLIVLTQEAYDKHAGELTPHGILIADSHINIGAESGQRRLYTVPFMELAERDGGKSTLINIVALGFFAQVNGIISEKSIRQAILARIPKMSDKSYIDAFERGLKAASEYQKESTIGP